MNEIMRKKVVKIMPGKDYESQEYKAYDLQNTILIGKIGSGVTTELNNIILNLAQEYSPMELGIQFISTTDLTSPWLNKNRKLPHMDVQVYCSQKVDGNYNKFIESVVNCIYVANLNHISRTCDESQEETYCAKKHLIVLDVDGHALEDRNVFRAIRCLLHFVSNFDTGCKVLLVTHDMSGKLCQFERYLDLRLLTRTSELISNKFLGCNLASNERDTHGFVWVTEKHNPNVKRKLEAPYKPASLYNKLCKYLCNSRHNEGDTLSTSWEGFEDDNIISQLIFFTAYIRGKYEGNSLSGLELVDYLKSLNKEELCFKFLDIYSKYIKCNEFTDKEIQMLNRFLDK